MLEKAPPARSVARSRQSCLYSSGVGVISMQGFPWTAVGFGFEFFNGMSVGSAISTATLGESSLLLKGGNPG